MRKAMLLAFLLVNLWTIACFWHDKARAVAGGRRVPERDLLLLAAIGGTPAALAARHLLRHKTRKEPFSTRLKLVAVVQTGLLIGWFAL